MLIIFLNDKGSVFSTYISVISLNLENIPKQHTLEQKYLKVQIFFVWIVSTLGELHFTFLVDTCITGIKMAKEEYQKNSTKSLIFNL